MIPIRYSVEQFEKLRSEGAFGKYHYLAEDNSRRYPDKPFLVDSKNRVTFSEFKEKADRLAFGLLQTGLKRDDRILVQLPNVVEWNIVYAALQRAGLIGLYVMLNFRHKEIGHACRESEAAGCIIMPHFNSFSYLNMMKELQPSLPGLKHIFVVGDKVPDGTVSINKMIDTPLQKEITAGFFDATRIGVGEVSMLRVTSGTTGLPKLIEAVLTGKSLKSPQKEKYGITHDDIFAALAPLSGGPSGIFCRCGGLAEQEGCSVALLERFDAEEAVKLIQNEKVTFATGVPTMMAKILNLPNLKDYDLSSLRAFKTAGAYLPYKLAKEFEEKIGCMVLNHLGGVDHGFASTTSVDDPPEKRWTSVGKPLSNVNLKLVDDDGNEVARGEIGEIAFARGDRRDRSFYRDLKSTLARQVHGLNRTGDLGKFDEQGYLYIVGRKKDVIIRGGQNIFPAEIEGMLITHPSVTDVAVVSMPDKVMGEKACAYVICKPGCTLTFDEMTSFLLRKKVAKYKLPERLELVDSFPYSGDGQKVMKRKLTEDVTARMKAEGAID